MDHSTASLPAASAVIIGIDHYQDARIPALRFARKDARAFFRALSDSERWGIPGGRLNLLLNQEATRENIRSAIGMHLRRRAGIVYIYFAGYGAPALNLASRHERPAIEKYLLPADANPEDLPGSAISLAEIKEFLEWRQAEQVVLLLDSSFSPGEGGRSFRNPRFPASIELTDRELEILAGEGTAILTACRAGEVALELAPVGHGLFTYFLLEGLKGQVFQGVSTPSGKETPQILLDDLYEYVYANVQYHARKFGCEMQPLCAGTLQGDIFLQKYLPTGPAAEERLRLRVQQLYALAKRAHQKGDEEALYRILQNVLDIFPGDEKARKVLTALEKKRHSAVKNLAPAPRVSPPTVAKTALPEAPRPASPQLETPPAPVIPGEKKAPLAAKTSPQKLAKVPRKSPRSWVFTLLTALILTALMLMVYAPGLNRSEALLLFNSLDRNARPFRSQPAQLSPERVREMLRQHDFYERHWNETAPGFANRFNTAGDGLVLDFGSLLMWQRGGSARPLSFEQAQDYIGQLNRDNFGGYQDWRLPTLEEAMSLVEREMLNQDLNIAEIFDPRQRAIWTVDDESAARKWSVSFYDGFCFPNDVRFKSFYVRAVR